MKLSRSGATHGSVFPAGVPPAGGVQYISSIDNLLADNNVRQVHGKPLALALMLSLEEDDYDLLEAERDRMSEMIDFLTENRDSLAAHLQARQP
jgi:hypothetical protein